MKSREDKLIEAVEKYRHRSFDWRNFNCGLAAALIAKEYCGKDYGEKFRPLCEGKLSAMRLVRKHGGLDKLMDSLDFEEVPVPMAKRGDCVLSASKHPALGIVYDGLNAVFPTQFGLAFVKVFDCRKAWKVI